MMTTRLVSDYKQDEKHQITQYGKFKTFMKQYGWVGFGTYWGVWGLTFTGFYFSFKTGIIDYHTWKFLHLDDLENMYIKYAPKIGIDPDIHPITPKTESLMVALVASKITKPLQWLTTFAITPTVSRKLGYAPPKNK